MIIKHQQNKTKFSGMSFYMENHITLGGSYIYNKKKSCLRQSTIWVCIDTNIIILILLGTGLINFSKVLQKSSEQDFCVPNSSLFHLVAKDRKKKCWSNQFSKELHIGGTSCKYTTTFSLKVFGKTERNVSTLHLSSLIKIFKW